MSLEGFILRDPIKSLDRFLKGIPYSLEGGFHITISKLGCLRNFMYAFEKKKKKTQPFKETKCIKFNRPMEIMLHELVTLHAFIKC